MDKKPLVLLPPLSTALMELKETLQGNDQVEVYEAANIDEADQLFGVLMGALWLASGPKAAIDFMTSRGSEFKNQQSKFVLVAANKVIHDYMEQLKKCHIHETIDEQIPIKTLQYKINLLIKALPIPHIEKKEGPTTKILKKEEGLPIIENTPKLHMEKLIKGNENVASLFGSDHKPTENTLKTPLALKKKISLVLDKEKSPRKVRLLSSIVDSNEGLLNDKTSNLTSNDNDRPSLALKRKKETIKLDIENDPEPEKIVTLNSNADDEGINAKKKNIIFLNFENQTDQEILPLKNDNEDLEPLKKKHVELTLEETPIEEKISPSHEQENTHPMKERANLKLEKSPEEELSPSLSVDAITNKKEKISLDIDSKQEEKKSPTLFLEKDSDLEKTKLLLDPSPDNNQKSPSLTLEVSPENEKSKTSLIFDDPLESLPIQEDTSDNKSIDLSLVFDHPEDDALEKSIDDTLQNDLSKDKDLSQIDLATFSVNSFSLELSIDLLHKQKSPNVLLRSLAIIILKKHKGLTSYLMYDKISKRFLDLWIGHFEILNIENDEAKNALIQKKWDAYKNNNYHIWINLSAPLWKDDSFQQNKQELFMPIMDSLNSNLIGIVIIQFNKQVNRDQAKMIQTLSLMSSWVFLEFYKNTKNSEYNVNTGKTLREDKYRGTSFPGLWAFILLQIKKLFPNRKKRS